LPFLFIIEPVAPHSLTALSDLMRSSRPPPDFPPTAPNCPFSFPPPFPWCTVPLPFVFTRLFFYLPPPAFFLVSFEEGSFADVIPDKERFRAFFVHLCAPPCPLDLFLLHRVFFLVVSLLSPRFKCAFATAVPSTPAFIALCDLVLPIGHRDVPPTTPPPFVLNFVPPHMILAGKLLP